MAEPSFHVQIYRKVPLVGRQKWRWRAVAGASPSGLFSHERLASGEAYVNKQDMLETVWDLFGEAVRIHEVAK
jgi:hypothetical protein